MSIVLNLEASESLSVDKVTQALATIPGCTINNNGGLKEAYLPNSNVSATIKTELDDRTVLTEDLEGVNWQVGFRMYFDIDPTKANATTEVKEFIIKLSELTEAPFALSFQYETLYAKQDENGLVISDEM